MTKITRIKASDPGKPKKELEKPKKEEKPKEKQVEKPVKKEKTPKNPEKNPFILFRPFVALGRYLKNSWLELRQVRWPSRKATWKMVLAVFVYTLIFGGFLLLLDILFDLIFSKLLG